MFGQCAWPEITLKRKEGTAGILLVIWPIPTKKRIPKRELVLLFVSFYPLLKREWAIALSSDLEVSIHSRKFMCCLSLPNVIFVTGKWGKGLILFRYMYMIPVSRSRTWLYVYSGSHISFPSDFRQKGQSFLTQAVASSKHGNNLQSGQMSLENVIHCTACDLYRI